MIGVFDLRDTTIREETLNNAITALSTSFLVCWSWPCWLLAVLWCSMMRTPRLWSSRKPIRMVMPVGGITNVCLVVSSGYFSECLDPCEAVFDRMAPFVHMRVIGTLLFAVGFGRDDSGCATPFMSCACAGRIGNRSRLPGASTRATILVVSPPTAKALTSASAKQAFRSTDRKHRLIELEVCRRHQIWCRRQTFGMLYLIAGGSHAKNHRYP